MRSILLLSLSLVAFSAFGNPPVQAYNSCAVVKQDGIEICPMDKRGICRDLSAACTKAKG